MKRELGIARCGLACCLCSENVACKGCRRDGFLELTWCKDAEWCENRRCVIDKKLRGCYECEPAECRKGLYAEKIKARAFAEFAHRYGVEALLDCLERNEQKGIVYHREGIMGDYDDFDDLEALIDFIRTGHRATGVKIEHVAMYVNDLERARDFFVRYLGGESNEGYHNRTTVFRSYFIRFDGGPRLELMTKPGLSDPEKPLNRTGYAHIAFSVGSRARVDALTEALRSAGYEVVSGPRTTGDGYYESCIVAIEGNQIEITE